MRKRNLLILSSCILSFCLAACNNKNNDNTSSEVKENIPETEKANRSDLKYVSELDSYKKDDWKGHWIWATSCFEDSYVAFRKTFNLKEAVSSVKAYISAESKYFMWVNDELVTIDGSLKRGPTPYDSYYDEVEIKNLKQGENVIAILVAFNGRSGDGSINPTLEDEDGIISSKAGLLFEMQAGDTLVKSDNYFKAKRIVY